MPKISLFSLAFLLAAGAFWFTILTVPPKSEASVDIQSAHLPYPVILTKARNIPEELCGRFGECPRR